MADLALQARTRTTLGKKVKALRRRGITPANIYGHNVDSLAIETDTHDLGLLLRRAGRTALIQVSVEGEVSVRPVLVRGLTRKATTDQLLHVEFFQVSMREKLTVDVPVRLVGEAPIAEQGDAVVVQSLESVSVQCLPGDIPNHIDADISSLIETTSNVFVRDLIAPDGVEILNDPDIPVASVSVIGGEAEEDEAEAAEAAAADGGATDAETTEGEDQSED